MGGPSDAPETRGGQTNSSRGYSRIRDDELEAFGDEFARLAHPKERRALVESFGKFISETHSVIVKLGQDNVNHELSEAGGRGELGRLPSLGEIANSPDGPEPPGHGPVRGRGRRA